MIIGIALLVIGGLALLGFKLIPVRKTWVLPFVIIGLIIVTGLGATLWSSTANLLSVNPSDPSPTLANNPSQFSYSVTGENNIGTQVLDAQNHIIVAPANLTSPTTFDANFTIAIQDSFADERSVPVTCNTNSFFTQNVSASDSTSYTIVTKDTEGLPLIKIQDTSGVFTPRTRTFLLGGESSEGQDVKVRVLGTIDSTALGKVNVYNSIPISCQVAGQSWTINIQRITP